MATQGMVSILDNGRVAFKIVTGSEGMIADDLAAAILKSKTFTASGLYALAKNMGFGSEDNLVVIDGKVLINEDETHKKETSSKVFDDYWNTFEDPNWNPRQKDGTTEYLSVIDIEQ